MDCINCSKKITSSITGKLCTACYFDSKKLTNQAAEGPNNLQINNLIPLEEDKPILLGVKPIVDIDNPVHAPSKQKIVSAPNDGKKYCQSCIERYGTLNLASREWTTGYFVCDDCMRPLLEQQLDYDAGRLEVAVSKVKQANPAQVGPILNQFYELFGIPAEFRFGLGEQVLQKRNDIFVHHANALVNMTFEQATRMIEEYSVMLFQIKIASEPLQSYIDKVKYEERSKANLSGLDKSEHEFTKRSSSKTKLSQDEKMAKQLGMPVEKYREMAQNARKTEFKKITGT